MTDINFDYAAKPPNESPSYRKASSGCLVWALFSIASIALPLGMCALAGKAPLATPSLTSGRVVDSETLQPIQGATVTYRWWIQDYPAMDGGSPSNAFKVEFVTDSNGEFSYVPPTKCVGGWMTKEYPPEVEAKGYYPNVQIDHPGNSRIENGTTLILMKPERLQSRPAQPEAPGSRERSEPKPR